MRKPFYVSVIGLALTLASTGALAQAGAKPAPKKKPAAPPAAVVAPKPAAETGASGGIGAGDKEIGFFGSLSNDEETTSLTIGVSIGRYMTDTLQLRFTQIIDLSDDDLGSTVLYAPYGSLEYQFPGAAGGKLVPYAGGGLGVFLLSTEDIFFYSLFLTPTAGAKYFLSERTSLEYALSYQFPLVGEACATGGFCESIDITTLQNSLRFNIYF